jgi:hypothetical protein
MSWPVARIGDFARRLGAAQARWIDAVPDVPWLSRRWLAQYLSEGPAHRVSTVDWAHPVAAAWPGPVRAKLRRLWADRDRYLARAESFPRTVCHLDVWPNNLVGDALVDWSFVGEGAVGEDPANLIVDSVADGLMDMSRLPAIAEAVTDGYVAGLRDGGYTGPADAVRAAIRVCGAAKYCWLGPAVLGRVARGATVGHPEYARATSGTEALLRLRDLVTLIAEWAG